jgi:hypothetical protein
MAKFLNNINLEAANDIQFKTTAGANAGKIEQDGNNLVLSNAVGDVLLGDGSSDVYIGDGTNNVDVLFEQSGSIKGDGSAVTLTIGGANTTLNLENPNINGTFSIGSTTINNKLTFTTSNGYILFDHEPTTDAGEYSSEVPLLKVDRSGTELTVLSRLSNNGAIALGNDDTVAIVAGDVKTVIKDNLNYASENVVFAAEGGFYAYGFPSNDPTDWSNRNELRFRADSATASENGLYIGDGTHVQFIDINRNLKNIGTLGIGTASPNALLNVQGDSDPTILINAETGNSANSGKLAFAETDGGAHQAWMKYDGFANRLEIGTAQVSQAFVINRTDGNVGIGTAIPTRKLHLKFTDDDTDLADANGIRIENESLTSGAMAVAHFRVDSNDWYLGNRKVGSTSDFFITHEASELLTIDNLGNVGIGTTSPSDQDLSINTPKLHVVGPSTTDAFNLVARFQGGNDSDNTGAAILINHSNDRGLLINAGRADSDREVAYFNLVSSGANITNMLTLKKVGEAYNVGIKTTSPAKELDVVGTVRAVDTSGNDQHQLRPTQLISYATDAIINAQSAGDDVRLNTQSNTVLIATAEGDVGIGTTSPASTLEIEAPSSANGTELKITSAFGESPKILSFDYVAANTNTSVAQIIGFGRPSTSGGPYMQFKVHTGSTLSEAMRITSSGDVGIGTTSPAGILEIAGNTDTNSNFLIIRDKDPTAGSARPSIRFAKSDGTVLGQLLALDGTNQRLQFSGDNTQDPHLTVYNNGNVGIGTTSPFTNLEVAGSGLDSIIRLYAGGGTANIRTWEMRAVGVAGEGLLFRQVNDANNSYTNRMIIDTDGNVGIGTITPDSKLHIDSTGEALRFTRSSQETYRLIHGTSGLYFTRPNSASLAFGVTQNSDFDIFDTSANVMFRADASTGDVGIGTTSPSRPLHVLFSGDSGARIESTDNHSSLYIESHSGKGQYIRFSENTADKYWINSSGGKLYFRPAGTGTAANQVIFDSSGNVGIGTTGPSQKLHVVGNTTTTGVSYTDIVQTYSGSSIDFRHQDASVVMRVDTSNARVGIGTTSPDHKLHVKGDVTIDNESSSEPSMLHFNATNKSNHDPTARINFWEGDSHTGTYTGSHAYIEYNGSGAGGGDGYLAIGGNTDSGANSDIMVINRLGRVGIGVAIPTSPLTIKSNSVSSNDSALTIQGNSNTNAIVKIAEKATDGARFHMYDGGVEKIAFYTDGTANHISAGNVGIGTTSPSAKLHVVTNNSPAQLYLQRTGSITGNYRLGVAGATNKFYITDVAQSQDRLVIDGSGNVTVSGNINVGEKIAHDGDSNTYMQLTTDQINFYAGNVKMLTLQESTHDQIVINENGADVNFRIETDTESNAFYMDGAGSGNVGIGTSTPSAKMHVEGTIKAKVYTVATLPSASPAGQRAFVSDSYYNLQESHGSGVYGGGSYFCPVYSDGSNWYNG